MVRIKQGSPLEEASIQAHLKRLDLEMNEDRELVDPDMYPSNTTSYGVPEVPAETHHIELEKLATDKRRDALLAKRASGESAVGIGEIELDLADLASIDEVRDRSVSEYVKRKLGRDDPTIAASTLQSTKMSLSGAAHTLSKINESGLDKARYRPFEKQVSVMHESLEKALSPEVLGYATPDDLKELKLEFSAFLRQFSQAQSTLLEIDSQHVQHGAARCHYASTFTNLFGTD